MGRAQFSLWYTENPRTMAAAAAAAAAADATNVDATNVDAAATTAVDDVIVVVAATPTAVAAATGTPTNGAVDSVAEGAAAATSTSAAHDKPPRAPKFMPYPSLLPDSGAASCAAALEAVGAAGGAPRGTLAVATPKLHGANMQAYVALSDPAAVHWGRRTAWLCAGESFYGHDAAAARASLPPKLRQLAEALAATRPLRGVAVFFEVYGGAYPIDAAATSAGAVPVAAGPAAAAPKAAAKPAPRQKPVQQGVWYAPTTTLAAFDVRLDAADGASWFMDWDDAASVLERAGIPVVPAVFRGPATAACAWASAHAADNAVAHYNPSGQPLLPDNGGEGWVVRLVCEAVDADGQRALVKIKNARFAEVAHGGGGGGARGRGGAGGSGEGMPPDLATANALADMFLTPARMAAVASKELPANLHARNTRALTAALVADARADATWSSAAAGAAAAIAAAAGNRDASGVGADLSPAAMRTFTSRAAACVSAWLRARNA